MDRPKKSELVLSDSEVHESCDVKIDSDYRSTVMLHSFHVGYKYPSKTWPPAPPIEEMWKKNDLPQPREK